MALAQITDHSAKALARLMQKLKGKPLIEGLITASSTGFQTLEDTLWSMYLITVDNATGDALDQFGAIVGQARGDAADDTDYRLMIKARVQANRSHGTVENILAVFRNLVTAGQTVQILQQPPAGFVLRVSEPTTAGRVARFAGFLRAARKAGITGIFEWFQGTAAMSFTTPISTNLSAAHLAGVTLLNVYSTAAFPASGSVQIDTGLATQETVAYSFKTATTFTLSSALTQNHSPESGQSVVLLGSPGDGFSSTIFPALGGELAGAIKS